MSRGMVHVGECLPSKHETSVPPKKKKKTNFQPPFPCPEAFLRPLLASTDVPWFT
jgi:hypothetical protein